MNEIHEIEIISNVFSAKENAFVDIMNLLWFRYVSPWNFACEIDRCPEYD